MQARIILQELFASYVIGISMNLTGKIYLEVLSSAVTISKAICPSPLSTAAK